MNAASPPAGLVCAAIPAGTSVRAAELGAVWRALACSVCIHAGALVVLGASVLGAPLPAPPASARMPAYLRATLRLAPAPAAAPPRFVPVLRPDIAAEPPRAVPSAAQPSSTGGGQQQAPNLASSPVPPLIPVDIPDIARYYLPREVDQPAAPLVHAHMLYPEDALKRRIGGVVVMHVYIGASGRIERTEVVRADPPGVFEQAVREALAASRFRPAMLGRASVNSRVTIEVPFDPDCSDFMTCSAPAARSGSR